MRKLSLLVFFLLISSKLLIIKGGRTTRDFNKYPGFEQHDFGYWNMQRSYPNTTIPPAKFYDAYEETKRGLFKSSGLNAQDTWKNIGPYNQGGRTNALAVDPNDPNIVYAGSASGGLWKMTITGEGDEDYYWERIDTGFPVLGVNAITVDPRDSNVLYAGTGEVYDYQGQDGDPSWFWIRVRGNYGIGLLKSVDGGENWVKSIDWTYDQRRGVLSIELDPVNPDIVFAGTTEGVYKSVDSGENWALILPVIMAVDVAVNPENPDIVYASCGNLETYGVGIYRSMDGGSTWIRLTNGLPERWSGKTMLEIYKSSPNIIYADVAEYRHYIGLFKSEDNGENWEFVNDLEGANSYGAQGYFSHFVRVNPIDNSKIFAAKVVTSYSEDGGETFITPYEWFDFYDDRSIPHPDHHSFANHPADPETFFLGNDGGVYKTVDGGLTFKEMNWGYITSQFYPGFSSSITDSSLALGGLQDNGTTIYTGSQEWMTFIIGGDGGYTGIDPEDPNIVFASSQFLNVHKSVNKGIDFGETLDIYRNNRHEGENAAFFGPFVIPSPNTMYGATNYVYRSLNKGEHWEVTNNNYQLNWTPVVAMDASRTNPSIVYAATVPDVHGYFDGSRPYVYRSSDTGDNWTNITANLPDRFIVDLAVSSHNPYEVYAVLSGFGTSHLFRLTEGVHEWQDIGAGLPDVPTNAVAVDPLNYQHIYVGNDLGVWVSVDDGETWSPFKEDMPNACLVFDLSISESNRKIRAVTHGNGVYERPLIYSVDQVLTTVPTSFELYRNYPNPFNPETTISFSLFTDTHVTINIYSITGQRIRNLNDGVMLRGIKRVVWDGTNDNGIPVGSGIYIYSVKAVDRQVTRRMTLIR